MPFDKTPGAPSFQVQAERQLAENPIGLDSEVRDFLFKMHGEQKARRMIIDAANATGQAERIRVNHGGPRIRR